jgi:hypothetical protein
MAGWADTGETNTGTANRVKGVAMIIDIDDYLERQSRRSLADRERVAEYYGSAPLFDDQRPGESPVRWLGAVTLAVFVMGLMVVIAL